MNDALKLLYEEHSIIVNAIDAARNASSILDRNKTEYEIFMRELIHFFRTYADQYHHHKEEEILFPEMARRNELLAGGVLHEMLENHADFRSMIKSIEANLDTEEYRQAQSELMVYTDALLDHIAAENDELFPMSETLFNDNELRTLFYKFKDCDQTLGEEPKEALAEFSRKLASRHLL